MPFSAAAHEEQDRHDDEDDHEDRSNDADAKCCDHDRASLFKSAQTRTISNAPMMSLPSACGCLNSVIQHSGPAFNLTTELAKPVGPVSGLGPREPHASRQPRVLLAIE